MRLLGRIRYESFRTLFRKHSTLSRAVKFCADTAVAYVTVFALSFWTLLFIPHYNSPVHFTTCWIDYLIGCGWERKNRKRWNLTDFRELFQQFALKVDKGRFVMKYIPSPVGQPRTKGLVLFLDVLRCSQIGLPWNMQKLISRITVSCATVFIPCLGMVRCGKGVMYLTSPGRPTDISSLSFLFLFLPCPSLSSPLLILLSSYSLWDMT